MSPRTSQHLLRGNPKALDIEDRAGSLGFGLLDDVNAFPDLERLLPRLEHPMDQHGIRTVGGCTFVVTASTQDEFLA